MRNINDFNDNTELNSETYFPESNKRFKLELERYLERYMKERILKPVYDNTIDAEMYYQHVITPEPIKFNKEELDSLQKEFQDITKKYMLKILKKRESFLKFIAKKHLKWFDFLLFKYKTNWLSKKKIQLIEKQPIDLSYSYEKFLSDKNFGISVYGKIYWMSDYKEYQS